MRWILLVIPLFILGCTSTTITQNQEPAPAPIIESPPVWVKYSNPFFSFDYPADMQTKSEYGLFSAINYLPYPYDFQPAEMLNMVYVNTSEKYGPNQNSIFLLNPTKSTSDFLIEDKNIDPFLLRGYDMSNITAYTVAEKFYVAQISFKLSDFDTVYHGYALSVFIPSISMHTRITVLALDPLVAYNMKEAILRSLRLEK